VPLIGKLRADHAPLAVVIADAEAQRDRLGLQPGEDHRAAVTLFHRGIPKYFVTIRPRDVLYVTGMTFRLLQANHVRLRLRHEVEQSLLVRGADTIDVPRDKFHRR